MYKTKTPSGASNAPKSLLLRLSQKETPTPSGASIISGEAKISPIVSPKTSSRDAGILSDRQKYSFGASYAINA